MSETSRMLRRQLEGKFPQGNPLTILGISVQVLYLGLTEDELYDYIVKDVARRLVMRFHSDRVTETEKPGLSLLHHRYSEAYEQIKDRVLFDEALAEFRNLKAEERREITLMSKALAAARQEMYRVKEMEPKLNEGLAALERDRLRFEHEEKTRAAEIPKLNSDIERLHKQNGQLRTLAEHWGRRTRAMNAYMSLLMGTPSVLDLGPHAFDAKWVAVMSLVPNHDAKKVEIAFTPLGNLTREFRKACAALNISRKEMSDMRDRWLAHVEVIEKDDSNDYMATYVPRLTLVSLASAKPKLIFGYQRVLDGGRVIGSISPQKTSIGRRELTANAFRTTMFDWLAPNLTVGGLLVHGKLTKAIEYPSGLRTISDSLNTKLIILGAG
jgi:hypothetical protein